MNDTNEKDEEIDNKKLLEDLNELEDDENSKKNKERQRIKENKENFLIVLTIICIIICGILYYYKNHYNKYEEYYEAEGEIFPTTTTYDANKVFSDVVESDEYVNNEYESDNQYITEYGNYDDFEKKEKARFEKEKTNIVSNVTNNINKELIATITNNNSEAINAILVYVIFYNENNQIIKVETNTIDYFQPNSTYYWKMENAPAEYSRYDIFIDREYYGSYDSSEYISKDITYTDSLEDGNVVIQINNNSNTQDGIAYFDIIYFDSQNNILDVEEVYSYEIQPKKQIKIMGSGVWNFEQNQEIPFERYEVVLEYSTTM